MRSGGAHGQADHVCRGNCPCWHAVESGSRRLTFGHGSCRFHISEGSSPAKRLFIDFGKGTFSRKHRLDTARHLESTHQTLQSSRRCGIQTSSSDRERATFASTVAAKSPYFNLFLFSSDFIATRTRPDPAHATPETVYNLSRGSGQTAGQVALLPVAAILSGLPLCGYLIPVASKGI